MALSTCEPVPQLGMFFVCGVELAPHYTGKTRSAHLGGGGGVSHAGEQWIFYLQIPMSPNGESKSRVGIFFGPSAVRSVSLRHSKRVGRWVGFAVKINIIYGSASGFLLVGRSTTRQ